MENKGGFVDRSTVVEAHYVVRARSAKYNLDMGHAYVVGFSARKMRSLENSAQWNALSVSWGYKKNSLLANDIQKC